MTDPAWAKQAAIKVITLGKGKVNAETIKAVSEWLIELMDNHDRIRSEAESD